MLSQKHRILGGLSFVFNFGELGASDYHIHIYKPRDCAHHGHIRQL